MSYRLPFRTSLVGGLLACAVALTGCGVGAPSAATAGGGSTATAAKCGTMKSKTIKFVDNTFQTLWINNAIAEYIITNGFCYPTQSETISTAVGQETIANGQTDVWMELWQNNIISWYDKVIKAGQLVNLGNTYDASSQGWYVPKYMISGDAARGIKATAPGLTSVTQLSQYWQDFQDPHNHSKGLFINCITSWQCSRENNIRLQAYGLTKYFDTQEPGTAPALDAAIVGAYTKGQPFLAYYWAPTWLLGKYDLVQLKQPAYTDACNAEIQKALDGKVTVSQVTSAAGCAYDSFSVQKGVNAGLLKSAPAVVAFLRKMDVGNGPLQKTAAYMAANQATAAQAAQYFFENYQGEWEGWLPADVALRVKNALIASGAKLA